MLYYVCYLWKGKMFQHRYAPLSRSLLKQTCKLYLLLWIIRFQFKLIFSNDSFLSNPIAYYEQDSGIDVVRLPLTWTGHYLLRLCNCFQRIGSDCLRKRSQSRRATWLRCTVCGPCGLDVTIATAHLCGCVSWRDAPRHGRVGCPSRTHLLLRLWWHEI
jgi:hypothetical protein